LILIVLRSVFLSFLGAGGKGTWGRLGCELELPWVDPHDPNYESDVDLVDLG